MIHLDEYLKEYYILFNKYDGIPHHDNEMTFALIAKPKTRPKN